MSNWPIITFLIIASFINFSYTQKVYPTSAYALINGQIVDIQNQTIVKATVLIKNGLIEKVQQPEESYDSTYEVIDL